MNGQIVVIGASVAAASFISEARWAGYTGRIRVIDRDPDAPYDRPALSKGFLLGTARQRPAAPWWDDRCELTHGWVESVYPEQGMVFARLLAGGTLMIAADHIVIATGAVPSRIPGLPEGVLSLRTAADGRVLRDRIGSRTKVVVLGAGVLGSEIASTLSTRGCAVTMVDRAPAPLHDFLGGHMGFHTRRWAHEAGIDLWSGVDVHAVERTRRGWRVLAGDTALRADLVVNALGTEPATSWSQNSGLLVRDGIVCDEGGRALAITGAPLENVSAIGDVARWSDETGGRAWSATCSSARRQGRQVADRLFAGPAVASTELPVPVRNHRWTRVFGRCLQVVGAPDPAGALIRGRDRWATDGLLYSVENQGRMCGLIAVDSPFSLADVVQRGMAVAV